MGMLYTHFPKMPSPFLITPKKKKTKTKKREKNGCNPQSIKLSATADERPLVIDQQLANQGWLAISSHLLALHRCLKFPFYKILLFPPAQIFLYMWSTLAGWL
jgi:hypothetical protein